MDKPPVDTERMLRRIRSEFLEMPGLRLTAVQAQRLWGLSSSHCEAILNSLVQSKFLWRGKQGTYARRTSHSGSGSPARQD